MRSPAFPHLPPRSRNTPPLGVIVLWQAGDGVRDQIPQAAPPSNGSIRTPSFPRESITFRATHLCSLAGREKIMSAGAFLQVRRPWKTYLHRLIVAAGRMCRKNSPWARPTASQKGTRKHATRIPPGDEPSESRRTQIQTVGYKQSGDELARGLHNARGATRAGVAARWHRGRPSGRRRGTPHGEPEEPQGA